MIDQKSNQLQKQQKAERILIQQNKPNVHIFLQTCSHLSSMAFLSPLPSRITVSSFEMVTYKTTPEVTNRAITKPKVQPFTYPQQQSYSGVQHYTSINCWNCHDQPFCMYQRLLVPHSQGSYLAHQWWPTIVKNNQRTSSNSSPWIMSK